MRVSVRASIVGTFLLLLLSLCLVGLAAIFIASRSQQQVTTLHRRGLIPAVGLSSLSQSLDEERTLLSDDTVYTKANERRAIRNELTALDASISRGVRQVLQPSTLPQWTARWQDYLAARGQLLQTMQRDQKAPLRSARYALTLHRVSNRLDRALDVVLSASGRQLSLGQRLYAQAVGVDGMTIRLTIVTVALSLLLGLCLVVLIARRLGRGLTDLIMTAKALSQGHLEVRADERSADEFGVVARAFNHMTDALLTMEHAALTDVISGLGNHRAFQEEFTREVARATRYAQPFTLALVDLDDFKVINDQYGHSHGDQVLTRLGKLLRTCRAQDRPFRIGGDEFALLMPHTTAMQAAVALERLRLQAQADLFGATLSIGIAELLAEDTNDSLREQADAALYEAKRRGRNTVVTFDVIKAHTSIVSGRKITAVRRLLAERRLSVAFQPIWGLDESVVIGYEALMRPAPDYDVSPAEAFDIAEKLGRGPELDEVCRHAALARAGELPPDVLLFMNLSPQSLDHPSLHGPTFTDSVVAAGLAPSRVVLEITERAIARIDMVVREARRLRASGFQVALDDVGAGNAGLEILRRLPVDYMKLDRSVVAEALVDQAAYAVLSGIVAFARRTHTFVIAEGIETQEMLDVVWRAGLPDATTEGGIQGAQGYLLGKPSEVLPLHIPDDHAILPFHDLPEYRRRRRGRDAS
jgi:diguanylate cyclase (GGDEF)-like protein